MGESRVQYDTEIYWPWTTARSDQGSSTTKMIGFDEARSKQKFDLMDRTWSDQQVSLIFAINTFQ